MDDPKLDKEKAVLFWTGYEMGKGVLRNQVRAEIRDLRLKADYLELGADQAMLERERKVREIKETLDDIFSRKMSNHI